MAAPKTQKRAKPWPLERAELIKRHNENTAINDQVWRARCVAAKNEGYDAALSDVARHYAGDAKWQKAVYEEAIRELTAGAGAGLGLNIDKVWRPFDAAIDEKQRLRRKTLDAAMSRVALGARSHHTLGPAATIMEIRLEPLVFAYKLHPLV